MNFLHQLPGRVLDIVALSFTHPVSALILVKGPLRAVRYSAKFMGAPDDFTEFIEAFERLMDKMRDPVHAKLIGDCLDPSEEIQDVMLGCDVQTNTELKDTQLRDTNREVDCDLATMCRFLCKHDVLSAADWVAEQLEQRLPSSEIRSVVHLLTARVEQLDRLSVVEPRQDTLGRVDYQKGPDVVGPNKALID